MYTDESGDATAELVRAEIENGIGWLVLNRPDKLNALNPALFAQFDDRFRELRDDPDVRVIIIRGEGRAFSVGFDVTPSTHPLVTQRNGRVTGYQDWLRIRSAIDRWLGVWRCDKPVIAAIHGYCMGVATILGVCCDLTIVARDAEIGWPKLPLGGGLLGPASAWLIGPKRAKEMSFITGNSFSGVEAEAWGWANRAVDASELLATAERMARTIAKVPADILTIKKRAINHIMDAQGFAESLYHGAEWDAIAHDSDGCIDVRAQMKEYGLKEAIRRFADIP